MWQSVICCPLGRPYDVDSRLLGVMNVWIATSSSLRAVFLSVPDVISTGHQRRRARWSRSVLRRHRWRAGRRAAKYWFRRTGVFRAMLPQNRSGSLGLLMTLMGLLIRVLRLPLASRYRIRDRRLMALARLFAGRFTPGAIIALLEQPRAGRHAPSSPS